MFIMYIDVECTRDGYVVLGLCSLLTMLCVGVCIYVCGGYWGFLSYTMDDGIYIVTIHIMSSFIAY